MMENDSQAMPKNLPSKKLEPPIAGMKGRAHELYKSRIIPLPAVSPGTKVQRSPQRMSCSNISNSELHPAHSGGRSGISSLKRYSTNSFGSPGAYGHNSHQFILPQSIPEVGQLNQSHNQYRYQQQPFQRRKSYMGSTLPEPMPTFRRHAKPAHKLPGNPVQPGLNHYNERPLVPCQNTPRRSSCGSMSSLKSMESSAPSFSPRTADTSSLMSVEDRFVPKHWHPKSTEKLYALARRSESMVSLASMVRSPDVFENYQQPQPQMLPAPSHQYNYGSQRNMQQQPMHPVSSSYNFRANQRLSMQLPRSESFVYSPSRRASIQNQRYGSMQQRDMSYDRSRRNLQSRASASHHHILHPQNMHTKGHQNVPNHNNGRLLNNARLSYTNSMLRTEPIKTAPKFNPQFKKQFITGQPSISTPATVSTNNQLERENQSKRIDLLKSDDLLKREGSLKRLKTATSEPQQSLANLKHSEINTMDMHITRPPEPPATAGNSSTSSMSSPSSSTSIQPSTTSFSSSHTTDSSSNPVGANSVVINSEGKIMTEIVGALEHTKVGKANPTQSEEHKNEYLSTYHNQKSHEKKSSSSSLKGFFKKFFRSSKNDDGNESKERGTVHSSAQLSTVS